jgi:transcriptional regulator with XRE-family HTH domain
MMVPMARKENGDIDVAIGDRIARNMRALLHAKGWTQGQLAYQAGMTQAAISQLTMGRRRPSLQSIYQIAGAFGVTIEELAGFKPLQMPAPTEAPSSDRLELLETKFDSFEQKFERLVEAIKENAQSEAPPKSRRTPRRAG